MKCICNGKTPFMKQYGNENNASVNTKCFFGESIYMFLRISSKATYTAFKVQMLAVCMLPGNVLLLIVTILCQLSYKEPLMNYFSTAATLH